MAFEIFSLTDQAFVNRVRTLNTTSALLFLVAALLNFILLGGFSIPKFINSIFVIIFALLLLLFETHFSWAHAIIANNLALILGWKGRTAFTFFVSSLAIGLGIVGIIGAIVGFFDFIVNLYGIIARKDLANFFEFKHLYEAQHAPAANKDSNVAEFPVPPANPKSPAAQKNKFDGALKDDDWSEVVDAETGNRYYYNKTTGKTSWSKPN